MDFDAYVAARRTRLVEHAVDLGVDEALAPALVDQVLAEQRRRIIRADDPDPVVHDALERVVRGPWPHRRTAVLVTVATVLVLVVAGLVWWQTRPPEQVTVPSAFALDAPEARAVLRRAGLESEVRTAPVCEPPGLVVGSVPPAGSVVDVGSRVELRSAASPDGPCPDLAERSEAWAFLRFTRGGPAPRFDDTVFVVLNSRQPAVLPAAAAVDPERWEGIQDVTDVASRLPTGGAGAPRLTVSAGVPPPTTCGFPRPPAAGRRATLRLQLSTAGAPGCPFTVDLYRDSSGVIDAVVIYSRA